MCCLVLFFTETHELEVAQQYLEQAAQKDFVSGHFFPPKIVILNIVNGNWIRHFGAINCGS